ncbi:hypothetical protein EMIHUDRAFT_98792 [Emiliania huxleyi CCMP1516]|uniref:Uncharacterized protein n=2 Tax=Emiliania huxleyi TaxID=2903 RepID=A0A0D3KBF2_EMIH1|nr:hypothetical protein EMIHUDRAFT_98792 [Emiliania huxleyi CCMP1516]EOD33087.1 hypothetical protein EMIHUDRAFT_98792 [Emiliania huxleyi CCMP1516]|eukprot:XP_005785516.1 hypothetical protein EMIHUDRAFT_98792 [Emiliania huxleyi CCMP1516]
MARARARARAGAGAGAGRFCRGAAPRSAAAAKRRRALPPSAAACGLAACSAHRYPKVRKAAADALYVHFLTYGDPLEGGEVAEGGGGGGGVGGEGGGNGGGEARLVEVERLLTETAWLADLEAAVRPAQARLLLLFGLDPPRAGERQPGERAARAAPEPEEEDSYAALVKELGY